MDLFDIAKEINIESTAPLADRMRPNNLHDIIGQKHILQSNKFLIKCIKAKRLPSLIFYGPPGTGKTTLARLLAKEIKGEFFQLNAVNSGIKEIKELVNHIKEIKTVSKKDCILFIDEIHRFSKNQQDALLPHAESGLLILIGATTENPYFQINNALLSRLTLIKLEELTDEDIQDILKRAIRNKEKGLGNLYLDITQEALNHIVNMSNGDARKALNALEIACLSTSPNKEGKIFVDIHVAQESIQQRVLDYDKNGDNHYDVISAFIKSIRGSDPDASLHYLAKMIAAGEDPEYIARRLIISASEDIGNADPQALQIAVSTHTAIQIIGMPEGRIPLAQATAYLASAPKSNASYVAIDKALEDISNVHTMVPTHLRDAHYKGAKNLGHGLNYLYPHNYPSNYVEQQYLPDEIKNKVYYRPSEQGYEQKIKTKLANFRKPLTDKY
ncbi:replication-associated recombination protein A [Serpentinicella sp. ANB-PHB4]|uniref:replication-associated recombination protein A n=1 Tax=Serpentinicella sp. ANB-PHB4 TaxID=3074076 RepID=UPI002857E442|nr:replication-associated recombination protein A [Serpentinicella sp. ANB-PHB4]MDR5658089.1 replication-associated recombination protein A [Serpentinicella sp. ANB-PHB4]